MVGAKPAGDDVAPIHHLVEIVQLAGVVERRKHERGQAQEVEVQRPSARPPRRNKRTARPPGMRRRRGTGRKPSGVGQALPMTSFGRSVKLLLPSRTRSTDIRRAKPRLQADEHLGHIGRRVDAHAFDSEQSIPRLDAVALRGAVFVDMQGNHRVPVARLWAVHPRDSILREPEAFFVLEILLEVDQRGNHRGDGRVLTRRACPNWLLKSRTVITLIRQF